MWVRIRTCVGLIYLWALFLAVIRQFRHRRRCYWPKTPPFTVGSCTDIPYLLLWDTVAWLSM